MEVLNMSALKLGTETGSMTNHFLSRGAIKTLPEVGSAATVLMWSDRQPATVVFVQMGKNQKTAIITVQEDHAERTDDNGMSECQEYTYSRNLSGGLTRVRYRLNEEHQVWTAFKNNGTAVRFGTREKYHDFSF